MTEPDILTIAERQRLENLLGSWELRARANALGADPQVLKANIAAVRSALSSADLVTAFRDGYKAERERNEKAALLVEEVRVALDEFAAFRGPRPKRVNMAALSNRLQAAFEALGGQ